LPGEETVVEVTYVQRLGADEGALRLMIPTLVAPRYVPGTRQGDRTAHGVTDPTDRVPDADRISPAIGPVQYGLSIDVIFDLGRDVTIDSPSHAIVVEDAGAQRRRVTFRTDTVPLDRDLVLLAAGAPGVAAGAVAERDPAVDQEGTFALTVVPDLFEAKKATPARDVVFVVDVSGSMGGVSIDQARSALRLCLRHLAEGDRFDVIAFSDRFFHFHGSLVPFTQRTLEAADRWVSALEVQGGTEMLEPLLAATARLADRTRDRIVVLLTDGQVGNESQIVERVAAEAKGARVYTFGIGTNTSDLLLRDLARRTRGAAEFIHPGERIDEKVTSQFARATATRVDEVTVRFVGIDAGELAPAELGALVDGEPWVVYGRYGEPGIGRAEIRGTLRGERFFLEVPVELPRAAARPGLTALWASARIRDLEETERTGRRAEAQKKRIVALSTTHGVASSYTSFVVIERRTGDRRAHGQPETRPVPVNAPAGWAMIGAPADRDAIMTLAGGLGSPRMRRAQIHAAPMSTSYGARSAPGNAPPPPPMAVAGLPAPAPASGRSFLSKAKAVAQEIFGGSAGPDARPEPEMELESVLSEVADDEGGRPMPLGRSSAAKPAEPAQALFGRQLASGLWEDDTKTDAGRLMATARALALFARSDIDTSHAVYGAQVKKAVEAILRLAGELGARGEAEREVMAALTAAFLVASGRRLRGQVVDLARTSTSSTLQALARHLTSTAAAAIKLSELGAI